MTGRRDATAAVALGSNLGDRARHLERAVTALRDLPHTRVLAVSGWFETDPVGGPAGQGRYLNGAVLLATGLGPRELLDRLLSIEAGAGRVRVAGVQATPRTLDLDLILHGDRVLAEPGLELPHPRALERAFVLEPLAAIAPELVFPGSGLTVRQALERLRAEPGAAHRATVALTGPLAGATVALTAPLASATVALAVPLASATVALAVPLASATVALDSPAEARAWCAEQRRAGRTIGFVPTMGALHEGHLELVQRAARETDAAVVSVFVNPLQFGDKHDFERYRRDFAGDVALLRAAGCALAFTGTLAQFFPTELDADGQMPAAHLVDPGPAALGLEGEFRPGHFAGVATIVARLFDVVEPTTAYFGEKDFQQTLVVRDLARRRGGPPIVVCPTSREASGLARSSRNERLSHEQRAHAVAVVRALRSARARWRAGERRPARLADALRAVLAEAPLQVEYAAVRDPERWTAAEPTAPLTRAQALVAARIGGVRLIDTLRLDGDGP